MAVATNVALPLEPLPRMQMRRLASLSLSLQARGFRYSACRSNLPGLGMELFLQIAPAPYKGRQAFLFAATAYRAAKRSNTRGQTSGFSN